MAIVNEVITKFSFSGSTDKLTNYNKDVAGSIKLLAGMAAGFATATAAVTAFTISTTKALDPLAQLSRNTKTSIQFLNELGFAASQSGSDLNAVMSTTQNLSKVIGEAAQKGSEDFARLGISVRDANGQVKNTEQILNEVRGSFNRLGLSQSERISFADKLGIDSSLIQLLNKSGAEIDALREKARRFGSVTREGADDAIALNDSVTQLKFGMNAIQQQIAIGLAPELTALTDRFSDLLAENKDWIIDGAKALVEWLGAITDAIVRLTPVLAVMAAGWTVATLAAGGFAAVMAVVLSPVVLITSGIAALLLVLDDLIVAFNGGDSVIAKFFDRFLGIDIQPVLQDMWEGFKAFFNDVLKFGENVTLALGALFTGNLMDAFTFFSKAAGDLLRLMLRPITIAIDAILGALKQIPSLEGAANFVSGGVDTVKGFFGFGGGQTTSNNANVNQQNQIVINTNDPQAAGTAVANNLNGQITDVVNQTLAGGK